MILLLALFLPATDDVLDAVKKAIETTASDTYSYRVKGRFDRNGEFKPGDVLTCQIKPYRSIRHGTRILVKGPEGLWRTPEERLGERVENEDKNAPAIVRTLQEAEIPHKIVRDLLDQTSPSAATDDQEVDGVMCRTYRLTYSAEAVKKSLEEQMEKSIKARTLERPDEVRWKTAAGTLQVWVARKGGHLVKIIDRRSVKTATKRGAGDPDLKTYKTELELEFSKWGQSEPAIPDEIRARLEIPRD